MSHESPTDAPWLSRDELSAWVATMALVSVLPAALDAQLKREAGLNLFEYQVFTRLSASPGTAVPMSDLAALAQGSPSRLSHAVARLERAGYVRRIACHEGGKRTAAILTDAGWDLVRAAAPGHVREVRRLVVDALTPDQLAALGEAARAIVAATDPALAESVDRAIANETAARS